MEGKFKNSSQRW